jgi:hypothetical protein
MSHPLPSDREKSPDSPSSQESHGIAVAGVALVLTLTLFWRVALSDKLLLRRDMLRVVLPLKSFWAERVRTGHFPDWYPYDAFGQPFAGMMVSGAFHPGNLLFLVTPAGVALKWNALLCFPLLATGLWGLLRRLGVSPVGCALGAVLGTFNGYAVCITNSLPYLQAMALVPWALLAALHYLERPSLQRAILGAFALALVLFAGDTESFAIVCSLTLLVAVFRPSGQSTRVRGLAWLFLMVLTGLVASPQLAAAAHVFSQSSVAERGLAEALRWSLHPLGLLEMVVGPLFGTGQLSLDTTVTEDLLHSAFGGLWVESVHFGAVGLLLGATGLATLPKRRLRIAAVAVVCAAFLLVLGKYGVLYEVLYRVLWLWRAFRYPEKLVPFLFLSLSIGAALGLDRIRASQPVRFWVVRCALLFAALLALLALGEMEAHLFTRGCQSLAGGVLTAETVTTLRSNFLSGCALSSSELLVAVWALRAPGSSLRAWAVPAVCMLVALIQGEPLYGANSPEVLSERPFTASWVLDRERLPALGGNRVYSTVRTNSLPSPEGVSVEDLAQAAMAVGFEPVTPALYGLEGANTYLPAVSARVMALRYSDVFSNRMVGLYGAAFFAATASDYRKQGGDPRLVVARSEPLGILLIANPTAKSRFVLRTPLCVASFNEALKRTTDPAFDPDGQAIVECQGSRFSATAMGLEKTPGTVQVVSYAPERIEFDTSAPAPAVLFVADAYYSGWSATVDGTPQPILPTNVAGRGLLLEGGKHRVVFRYRTPGLLPALALSLGILLLGGGLALARVSRRVRVAASRLRA